MKKEDLKVGVYFISFGGIFEIVRIERSKIYYMILTDVGENDELIAPFKIDHTYDNTTMISLAEKINRPKIIKTIFEGF